MSGHSKWNNIKRRKEAQDAKRGKLFTKLAREITVAAREGGDDPEFNFNLRLAVDRAKEANMPKDNIERAIKRGTGELQEGKLEEFRYEGYDPNGVALLIQALTDNSNRAVSDVRRTLSKHGGHLGTAGCVAWLFEPKGYITIEVDEEGPEELALLAIEAGAEDIETDSQLLEVYTKPENLQRVKENLERQGFSLDAELSMIPKTVTSLSREETMRTMRLIDALEELDDVQQVYSNLDIKDEMIDEYEAAA
ncbi:MAG: YebC/PmpR family DNA-binding transcriptional regulator [Chloroflexota bacterium]|nr:YebC/PmpR family DNA-binding transcriptional regulator [Chloroflexota bacterium]